MSEFLPPSGPPPPQVPEGWKAVWNDQYKEWFYVNIHTKASTWDKPTRPAPRPGDDLAPGGPPPGYTGGAGGARATDDKRSHNPFDSNNPYSHNRPGSGPGGHGPGESDEQMARRLQAEEDARTRGRSSHSPNPAMGRDRGEADSFYGSSGGAGGAPAAYNQATTSPRPHQPGLQGGYPGGPTAGASPANYDAGASQQRGGGGFLGKLKDKFGGGSSQGGYGQGAPGYGHQQGGYPPQPQGYSGQPYNQQGGYYPQQQQGYYGGGGGGMMPQQQYMQQPAKKHGGLGVGGAAALGVGGGLIGGMLLEDAINDHDENEYDQGYDQGYDDGGDMGGDF